MPATASTHSGSPPSCPTCGKVSSGRLRTSRARIRAMDELGFGEPVVVRPAVDLGSHPRWHTDLRPVPELPGPAATRGLDRGHRTCVARAPNRPLPGSDHLYRAD